MPGLYFYTCMFCDRPGRNEQLYGRRFTLLRPLFPGLFVTQQMKGGGNTITQIFKISIHIILMLVQFFFLIASPLNSDTKLPTFPVFDFCDFIMTCALTNI